MTLIDDLIPYQREYEKVMMKIQNLLNKELMNKQLKDFCEYIINLMEAMEPDTWTATEYNIYEYAMSLMEQYGDKQTI